ncbi:hypothetical protein ACTI_47390 [Actinoplanes sp. OR16]|uniref:hypothetical protein n=1 Tax=Actinoplanes sp. OR16 TaxID=946334 RepID=UPI000F6E3074|nr:hypothetical protein [Actinoplanes sp. OR16]BBH68054.1 hypothetical protein ACTI_47390 [Actinoplanes sp. OR16]
MRTARRRLIAATACLLLIVLLTLTTLSLVRWKAAAHPKPIVPPAGATPWSPSGPITDYERDVGNRAAIIATWLRTDRGDATVRVYTLPPDSPWLQSRKLVATQLDHWEQVGDCTDRPESRILECAWQEPTRWWPRKVQLTMLRPPPPGRPNPSNWPDITTLIIGSAPSE